MKLLFSLKGDKTFSSILVLTPLSRAAQNGKRKTLSGFLSLFTRLKKSSSTSFFNAQTKLFINETEKYAT